MGAILWTWKRLHPEPKLFSFSEASNGKKLNGCRRCWRFIIFYYYSVRGKNVLFWVNGDRWKLKSIWDKSPSLTPYVRNTFQKTMKTWGSFPFNPLIWRLVGFLSCWIQWELIWLMESDHLPKTLYPDGCGGRVANLRLQSQWKI